MEKNKNGVQELAGGADSCIFCFISTDYWTANNVYS